MGRRRLDLIGQRFGKLEVVEFSGIDDKQASLWKCLCECGNTKIFKGIELKRGIIKTCGCHFKIPRTINEDLVGKKFNKLKVLELDHINKHYQKKWLCECDCGSIVIVDGTKLKTGHTKSCGCLNRERQENRRLIKNNQNGAFNNLYNGYRHSAKARNLIFNLTFDEFRNITKQNCHYCNTIPKQIKKYNTSYGEHTYIYNGVDRVDNKRGYEIDNVVPCCGICNKMKLDMEYTDFIDHVKLMYINMKDF